MTEATTPLLVTNADIIVIAEAITLAAPALLIEVENGDKTAAEAREYITVMQTINNRLLECANRLNRPTWN